MSETKLKYITPVHFVPSHVMGRSDELAHIHAVLQSDNPLLLINGVAGIGKTTLAMQYVKEHLFAYRHIAWITISEDWCKAFFGNSQLLEKLRIRSKIETLLLNDANDKAFEMILNAISSLGQTLLVIDNAYFADLALYQKQLHNPELAVLITSRTNPTGWYPFTISHLPPELAAKLFRVYYPSAAIEDKVLDSFLARFEYLTLIIELLAKSARLSGMTFNKLDDLSKNNLNTVIHRLEVNTGVHGLALDGNPKRSTICQYFKFIFQEVSMLSEDEKNIMSVFCLAPPAKRLTKKMIEVAFRHLKIYYDLNTLSRLVEKGWLIEEYHPASGYTLHLHPAIKEFSFSELGLSIEFAQPLIDYAEDIINDINRAENYSMTYKFEVKQQWQEFIDHIRELFFKPDLEGT